MSWEDEKKKNREEHAQRARMWQTVDSDEENERKQALKALLNSESSESSSSSSSSSSDSDDSHKKKKRKREGHKDKKVTLRPFRLVIYSDPVWPFPTRFEN